MNKRIKISEPAHPVFCLPSEVCLLSGVEATQDKNQKNISILCYNPIMTPITDIDEQTCNEENTKLNYITPEIQKKWSAEGDQIILE